MALLPDTQRPTRRGDGLQVAASRAPAAPALTPRTAPTAAAARPTYVDRLTGNSLLPRAVAFDLLNQFYRSVPVMGQAIRVLAGFMGCPCLASKDEALAADLKLWAATVKFGYVGQGLAAFTQDLMTQALLYGYGVGEVVANTQRNELERLWSYESPSFYFRAEADGSFRIVQNTGFGQEVALNPETSLLTVPFTKGSNPQGLSLFFSSLTFAQGWMDVAHAYRAMWKRNGVPRYHVNWDPASELDDPDGKVAGGIVDEMMGQWNEVMRASVVDGQTKDFFSSGKSTVKVIGADGAIIDITISKRAFVEEIVAATGIPAWMLGYSWSTTERLSTQQADMLLATIDTLRKAMTPTIQRIVTLRQQLAARRGEWELQWSDVNLQDLLQTAQADYTTQKARETRQKIGRQLWTDGVWNQAQYAEDLTGSDEVAVEMDTPPSLLGPLDEPTNEEGDGDEDEDGSGEGANSLLKELEFERGLPLLREMLPEYAERFPFAYCNGRH